MGLITDPFTFVNADDAESSDINTRFNTLYNEINGALSNANVSSTAAIDESKVNLGFTTRDLQFRIGVGLDNWSGRKSLSMLRPVELGTFGISFPAISSFIAPSTNTPYGLEYDSGRGVLWYSDNGLNQIYQVNTQTSAIISSFNVTGFGVRDLAYDGSNLWAIGDTTDEVYRLDTTGVILSSFDAPSSQPKGLTYMGGNLYLSDSNTDLVYRLNTLGTSLSNFATPAGNPAGLANNGSHLFHLDGTSDLVYRMNILGTTLASFTLPLNIEYGAGNCEGRGFTYDGAHFWWVNGSPQFLVKSQWVGFTRAPVVRLYQSNGASDADTYPILYADLNQVAWAHHQYTSLSFVSSFETTNAAANGLAFKRVANRTLDDYYHLSGGTRVVRYRRGTFQSSFSLSGVTTLVDIVMGDNYMYLLSDENVAPDNYIYRIDSTVYDVDSLTRTALASFNWDAAAGFSDTTIGIGYDDRDPKQHALWICESGARVCARISTAAVSIYSSFTAPAAIAPPQSLRQVGNELYVLEGNTGGAAQLFKLGTTGTAISSWSLPRSGGAGVCDFLGLDWDERSLWIVGNDDGGGAGDDKIFQVFSHLIVSAEAID